MKYTYLKQRAIKLRKEGFSLKEISDKLHISKSTASTWLKYVKINKIGKNKLNKKIDSARKRGISKIKNKREKEYQKIEIKSKIVLKNFKKNIVTNKILCSLLYWCEGGKTESAIYFTNSDPILIKYFLKLLRESFNINEDKFRVCLHLHSYHNDKIQKIFWSKVTNIPINRFFKIYKKINTGKTKKYNYQGCVSIRYYDYKILKEINYIIKYLTKNMGG